MPCIGQRHAWRRERGPTAAVAAAVAAAAAMTAAAAVTAAATAGRTGSGGLPIPSLLSTPCCGIDTGGGSRLGLAETGPIVGKMLFECHV